MRGYENKSTYKTRKLVRFAKSADDMTVMLFPCKSLQIKQIHTFIIVYNIIIKTFRNEQYFYLFIFLFFVSLFKRARLRLTFKTIKVF